MNAAETIAAAIQKLEDLRDGATPGRWAYYNEPWGDIMSEQDPGLGVETSVAGEMSEFDGTLVVVLHRTIDAQLGLLRDFQERYVDFDGAHLDGWVPASPTARLQLELARSILRVTS